MPSQNAFRGRENGENIQTCDEGASGGRILVIKIGGRDNGRFGAARHKVEEVEPHTRHADSVTNTRKPGGSSTDHYGPLQTTRTGRQAQRSRMNRTKPTKA
eukprot:2125686-Prymnesium_polylepis.1